MTVKPLSAIQNWEESAFIPYRAELTCPAGPALVLAPHPDDEIFGCGGAILSHLAVGDQVRVIILTDSDYGYFAPGTDGRMARRQEAIRAAAVLGYGQPSFWGLSDRGLAYDEALIVRLLVALEETEAAILYSPSWWEIHPDHCTLAMAAAEAVRRCHRPVKFVMYEVGVPLHPNFLLDITAVAERKQAAMACFVSQLKLQRYDAQLMALHQFRTYTLPESVRFAEAFRLMDQEALHRDPLQVVRPGIYYAQSVELGRLAPPLVSILFIGGRAGLADALDSVLVQTYAHLEVVLVVDQGPDRVEVMKDLTAWRGGRFPLILVELEGVVSVGERANRAMERSRGKWLLLLDDGDSLEASHVATLVADLMASTPARCAYTGVHRVWEQEGKILESNECLLPTQLRGPEALLSLPSNIFLFARSLYEEGCRFDSTLSAEMAKWDFWLQLSNKTRWVSNPNVSAIHRESGPPASRGFRRQVEADSIAIMIISRWLHQVPRDVAARLLWEALTKAEHEHDVVGVSKSRSDMLKAHLQDAPSTVNGALDNLRFSNEQLAMAQGAVGETEALCERLQQKIDALQRSRSWQWTHPFRLIASLLRRARLPERDD